MSVKDLLRWVIERKTFPKCVTFDMNPSEKHFIECALVVYSNLKEVTINQISFIIWHIRGLCTIKTSCRFHSLKHPPHYKQSIYLIKLQKWLVLDPRCKVTSQGQKHLHKHASRARNRRIVIFSPLAPPTGVHSLNT